MGFKPKDESMLVYRSFSDSTTRSFVAWVQLAMNPKTLVYSPSGQGYVAPPTYTFPANLPAGTPPMALPDCYVPVIRDTGPGHAGDQCRVSAFVPMPSNDVASIVIFDANTGELFSVADPTFVTGMAGNTVNINM